MRPAAPFSRTASLLCVVMLCAGLLVGCGGLLPKAPERTLYRLNPAVAAPQPARPARVLLVIATPTAAAGLDTTRIALIRSPVTIDYYADGEWVDRPPFLVKEILIENFEKSGAFAGVASEGRGLGADYALNTDIRDFTAIYNTPDGPPLVRIRIAAELVAMPERDIAAETSIVREVQAGANDLSAIAIAFDRALGEVVRELIAWSASMTARAPSRRGR